MDLDATDELSVLKDIFTHYYSTKTDTTNTTNETKGHSSTDQTNQTTDQTINNNSYHELKILLGTKRLYSTTTSTTNNTTNTASITNTTTSSTGDNDNNNTNNERLSQLMLFTNKQQQIINSGQYEQLSALYKEYCTDNLILEIPTKTIPSIIHGCNSVINIVTSFSLCLPDFVLKFEKCNRYNRVITTKSIADGTFIGSLVYNPFKTSKLDPCITPETYAKYSRLEAENKPMFMRSKNYVYYILNEDMTHIERIIDVNVGREIYESKPDIV